MTPSDSKAFRSGMAKLYAVFDRQPDEVRTRLYWEALKEFPLQAVLGAMERAVRTCEFFPAPAKLREFMGVSAADAAEAGWLTLVEAVRRVGSYGRPELPSAVIDAMTAVWGGWQGCCRELPAPSSPGFEAARRQFVAACRVTGSDRLLNESDPPVALLGDGQ